MPKIRNIIIFAAIAVVFILLYVFFIKPAPQQADLVSSTLPSVGTTSASVPAPSSGNSLNTQDFLTLLLNVNNIKLDDTIFSDPAFAGLHDSSIVLTPDGTQGRPNPFAQFGSDTPPATTTTTTTTTTQTPVTPAQP